MGRVGLTVITVLTSCTWTFCEATEEGIHSSFILVDARVFKRSRLDWRAVFNFFVANGVQWGMEQ